MDSDKIFGKYGNYEKINKWKINGNCVSSYDHSPEHQLSPKY